MVGPGLHDLAPPVQQVRPGVGSLGLTADLVCKCDRHPPWALESPQIDDLRSPRGTRLGWNATVRRRGPGCPRRLRGRRPRGRGACPRRAGACRYGRCPGRHFGGFLGAGFGPVTGTKPAYAKFNVVDWQGGALAPLDPRRVSAASWARRRTCPTPVLLRRRVPTPAIACTACPVDRERAAALSFSASTSHPGLAFPKQTGDRQ